MDVSFPTQLEAKTQATQKKADRVMCDQCAKDFSSTYSMLEHQKVVHEGQAYKCNLCGPDSKLYSTFKALKRHKTRNHEDQENINMDVSFPPQLKAKTQATKKKA